MSIPGLGWANLPKSFFQNGVRSYKIAFELHAESRQKLVTEMASRGIASGVVLLQGGEEQNQYDTDTELVFRQDSWFNFLWGVREPGFYGAIELSSGKTTLFCPELPDSYRIWCGEIKSCEYFRTNYSVDNVLYTQSLPQWLTETLTSRGGKVYLLEGENSDSGLRAKPAHFDGIEALAEQIDLVVLHHALSTARVIKSTVEIEDMRYAALVASNAHVEVK